MTRNVAARLLRRAPSGIVAIAVALALTMLVPVLALAAPFAAYVIDARTGEVLYETNANTRLHPASLTKMMTLYVTFGAIERGEISLDSMVTVSKHAASQAPSRLGLRPGQKIALRYLIRAAAIKSANDAATAICEAVGGSEAGFARKMNATAKAIGMSRSTFKNCNGLTATGHLSTAHDMTVLGRHLFYDFPQYYGIFSRRSADAGMAQVASTNRRFLDSYEGADGIKTGYTGPAGFSLTASAQRGNKRIIATILGGKSTNDRNARMADLLDIGFGKAPNNAKTQKPLPPVLTADAADTGDAAADALAAAVAQDVAQDAAADIGANVSSDTPAAGKTLRLQMAVNSSPRPKVRPLPGIDAAPTETVAVAMADTIQNTSADLTTAAPQDAALDVARNDTQAPPVAEGPVFAQSTTPQPETAALAAAIAAEGGEVTTTTPQAPIAAFAALTPATPDLAGTSLVASLSPEPPADAPQADGMAAAIPPAARPKARPAVAAEDSSPDSTADAIAAAVAEAVAGQSDSVDMTGEADQAVVEAAPADGTSASTDASPADQIVLASVAPEDIAVAQGEIVSRASTSGGRQFGISLGRYPSRYDAERVLLQTALTEVSTLNEAPRRVVQRKGGYDANFVGMTEETAALACMRLQSRAADCAVFGPEG